MPNPVNAVYSNMYLVVTICAGKIMPKGPNNHHNIDVKWSRKLNEINPFCLRIKEQVCLDALLASLSGKNR